MFHKILKLSSLFFIVLSPIGSVPLVLSIVKQCEPSRRKIFIIRELLFALIVLLSFVFFGKAISSVEILSPASIRIGGGMILGLFGIIMMSQKAVYSTEVIIDKNFKEPILVPVAVPGLAGPGMLTFILMKLGAPGNTTSIVASAILLVWAASVIILMSSSFIEKALGKFGMSVVEKVFGFLMLLIATQAILNGFKFI